MNHEAEFLIGEYYVNVFPPPWTNRDKGLKMMLIKSESTQNKAVIKASAAELIITRAESQVPLWAVDWMVKHGPESIVGGRVVMDEETLSNAFGLKDTYERGHVPFLEVPDKFVRLGRYLNIPNRGSKEPGDPNVSIVIDYEMQLGIFNLLKN